jgi:hypothetical protein
MFAERMRERRREQQHSADRSNSIPIDQPASDGSTAVERRYSASGGGMTASGPATGEDIRRGCLER